MEKELFRYKMDRGVENSAFQFVENSSCNVGSTENIEDSSKNVQYLFTISEVMPRLENYRNSKRKAKRPSLGELHGHIDEFKDKMRKSSILDRSPDFQNTIKLGWIQGVLIPCLLNIWGVMLFLRLSWVVAEAGIGLSLVIIGISALVCIITTLSLSALCTNGEVKSGGMYYIISRSLGPEFGASVGIVFAFANAVSASMNTIGFCNSLSDLLDKYGYKIIDGNRHDARIIGTAAILIMIVICAVGMDWESKVQNFLIATIIGAMLDFIIGTIVGPHSKQQEAQGFIGFNTGTFTENWRPMFRPTESINYEFFQVFAIFFPSVTGIQAGANISGDLKDPATAIPKGTFLSLAISMASYALFVIFAGGAALRDASGNVEDLMNGNVTICAETKSCNYGLFNNIRMMQIMAVWEPLIYAGCFAATLSTALTNLLSVPRLIQALGFDKIYPGLIYFSKGYGKHGEPYRGYVLTFFVSVAFLLIADLNAIAPLISNFYLASYALINFCTFHAGLIKPLGWRPTFKLYSTWLSFFGFIMCISIMFLINWWSSLITFILIFGLYLLVVYRKPGVNWGSSTQAQIYKTALSTAQKLVGITDHVKNYKPQILLLCDNPHLHPNLVEFAYLITKNNSLLILAEILKEKISYSKRYELEQDIYNYLKNKKIKAFYSMIDNISFEVGARALLQSVGLGKLTPNVLMMGYKNNWMLCTGEEIISYVNVIHAAFEHHISVTIVRLKNSANLKKITEEHLPNNRGKNNLSQNLSCLDIAKKKDFNSGTGITTENSINKTAINNYLDCSENNSTKTMVPFDTKQNKGNIDVWWLYDDGGLTILIPYIISTRSRWLTCNLRIFALVANQNNIELEEKNMAHLLAKFRLDYCSLKMVSVYDNPQDGMIEFFENILTELKSTNKSGCCVSESELSGLQEHTKRQLRLRELLLENSRESNLVIMSLPIPRKGNISAFLYMAWLEVLTRDMPPYLLVRGNQQSVLTVYS